MFNSVVKNGRENSYTIYSITNYACATQEFIENNYYILIFYNIIFIY